MQVRVRMYRQGLGDCFLLTFGAGAAARHVLIDCGTLGATTTGVKMDDVVQDIHDTTGRHLDLLVATHEHKDHVSGFLTQQELFDAIGVDHVWQAWTENAEDDLAKQLKKYNGDLINAAKLAASALRDNQAGDPRERKAMKETGLGIRRLLAFVDEDALGAGLAKTVHAAMTYVTRKAPPDGLAFLLPGEVREPDWLPGVRVYVLGPPRSAEAIANLGEHGSPELYALAARQAKGLTASAAFAAAAERLDEYYESLEDPDEREELLRGLPFDFRHRLEAADEKTSERFAGYLREEEAWRRIDYDWMVGAAELALQLDGQTNNTSLALAFELIDDGRVLLFPADAQVGNWLSWHDQTWRVTDAGGTERTVTVPDLLARTVLYKVGHHASHNATVREKGLELMTHGDLVALIPVDRKVAMKKSPPWKMPARGLYRRLIEKAKGRVVRSDAGWASGEDADFKDLFTAEQWAEWKASQEGAAVEIEELYVDCLLE
jgi:hypothetical protein